MVREEKKYMWCIFLFIIHNHFVYIDNPNILRQTLEVTFT